MPADERYHHAITRGLLLRDSQREPRKVSRNTVGRCRRSKDAGDFPKGDDSNPSSPALTPDAADNRIPRPEYRQSDGFSTRAHLRQEFAIFPPS